MSELGEILDTAMAELAMTRPLFHSEFDWQFALAWQLQTDLPAARLRLEQPQPVQPRLQLDLLLAVDGRRYGIELKYPRNKLTAVIDGEEFVLSAGAPDSERRAAVRDVMRCEQLVRGGIVDAAATVVLTSLPIWEPPCGDRPVQDAAFRLHEGRVLTGELDWTETTPAGTRGEGIGPLAIAGRYLLTWKDYSSAAGQAFRYLTVLVDQTTICGGAPGRSRT
jgi:hypothetical protein